LLLALQGLEYYLCLKSFGTDAGAGGMIAEFTGVVGYIFG
jgi:hypothetical protein